MKPSRKGIVVGIGSALFLAGMAWWLSTSDEGKLIVAKVTNHSINCMPTMSNKGSSSDTFTLCEKAKKWGVKIAY